jgi:hypothetical protein
MNAARSVPCSQRRSTWLSAWHRAPHDSHFRAWRQPTVSHLLNDKAPYSLIGEELFSHLIDDKWRRRVVACWAAVHGVGARAGGARRAVE